MVTGFNHIGVVVESIDETLKRMGPAFGAVEEVRESIEFAGQTSAMIRIGDQKIEMMEPLGEKGTVPDFLKKHGEGLHHISLKVDDFEADVARFEENGYKVFGKTEMQGHHIAFIHPKTANGIVYEIAD